MGGNLTNIYNCYCAQLVINCKNMSSANNKDIIIVILELANIYIINII